MKSCPACKRTFEDTFTFCLIDGSVLSAPFDPEKAGSLNVPGKQSPPRTEVINVAPESLAPTQPALESFTPSTLTAETPVMPQGPILSSGADGKSTWLWIILVVVAVIAVLLLVKFA